MRLQLLSPSVSATAGLLFTLPTLYFILISVLKYGLGLPALFDAAAPTLEAWGIKEPPGWNITSLIFFGPLIALLLNATVNMRLDTQVSADSIHLRVQARKRPLNWLVIALSALCLAVLFVYMLGENCNC